MNYIDDLAKKKLRCSYCDNVKNVKYEIELVSKVIGTEPYKVYACNACSCKYNILEN